MKRGLIICFIALFLINFSFVQAVDDFGNLEGMGQEEFDKIEDVVDTIPIDEQGGLDEEKLGLTKTKAEQRIDTINSWIEENASWLRVIFGGMVPEISWKFIINILLIFFFLNLLVFFFPTGIPVFSENTTRIIGIGIFLIIMILGLTASFATWIDFALGLWWIKLIINIIIAAGITLLSYLGKYFKKEREKEMDKLNRAKLNEGVEFAKRFSKEVLEK
jgi:hypothetical protein